MDNNPKYDNIPPGAHTVRFFRGNAWLGTIKGVLRLVVLPTKIVAHLIDGTTRDISGSTRHDIQEPRHDE